MAPGYRSPGAPGRGCRRWWKLDREARVGSGALGRRLWWPLQDGKVVRGYGADPGAGLGRDICDPRTGFF